jgi:hypothetical protein
LASIQTLSSSIFDINAIGNAIVKVNPIAYSVLWAQSVGVEISLLLLEYKGTATTATTPHISKYCRRKFSVVLVGVPKVQQTFTKGITPGIT